MSEFPGAPSASFGPSGQPGVAGPAGPTTRTATYGPFDLGPLAADSVIQIDTGITFQRPGRITALSVLFSGSSIPAVGSADFSALAGIAGLTLSCLSSDVQKALVDSSVDPFAATDSLTVQVITTADWSGGTLSAKFMVEVTFS